jgi:RNA polymerase sigma factor (sigma-70 family)
MPHSARFDLVRARNGRAGEAKSAHSPTPANPARDERKLPALGAGCYGNLIPDCLDVAATPGFGVAREALMVDDEVVKEWFVQEILPLEPSLTRFIRRHCRKAADVADIRQDVYVRIYAAAREQLPRRAGPFMFTTARNHLINCAKRAQIVSIEYVADLEALSFAVDTVTPDRTLSAQDEFRRVRAGLDRLPPRCREVVLLRKIEGLSTREAAIRLHVGVDTVEQQMVHGMRALVDFMLGGSGRIRRPGTSERSAKKERKK